MLKGFLPKEFGFFDYFEEHISKTIKIAEEFLKLASDCENFSNCAAEIKTLEREADVIIRQCVDALHKTFITPIDRVDIYSLINKMDDVADFINSAVTRIELYEIKSIRSEAVKLAEILLESTKEVEIAIKKMRHMKEIDLIKEKCKRVHILENQADEVLKHAIFNLFKETDTILIIKWREIFDKIEKAVDRCEALVNIIEGIVIDNA